MLIRLSARIEGTAKLDESASSEEETYYPATEDSSLPSDHNDLLTRKSILDEDALGRRKQVTKMFQERAAMETSVETQAALDRQAVLFRDLGLDDQEPQSEIQTNNLPPTSHNPYALLQESSLNGHAEPDSPPVYATSIPMAHTMMPNGGSSFWARYGNKLRVNGTVEEVCIIE